MEEKTADSLSAELKIAKQELEVIVRLTSRETISGKIFLAGAPSRSTVAQLLKEFFRQLEGFAPLRLPDGSTRLINREHLVYIHSPEEKMYLRLSGNIRPQPLKLWLSSGDRLSGQILIDLPKEASRSLDYLNSSDPYIELQAEEGYYLINKRHVISAQD